MQQKPVGAVALDSTLALEKATEDARLEEKGGAGKAKLDAAGLASVSDDGIEGLADLASATTSSQQPKAAESKSASAKQDTEVGCQQACSSFSGALKWALNSFQACCSILLRSSCMGVRWRATTMKTMKQDHMMKRKQLRIQGWTLDSLHHPCPGISGIAWYFNNQGEF